MVVLVGIPACVFLDGANPLNVGSFRQRIITGALIIAIVCFDGLRRRRSR